MNGHQIKLSAISDYVVGGVKTVAEAPANIVRTVYGDAKNLISGADTDINKILDRGTGVIKHTIDSWW